jgi:hypothetical protein
LLYVYHKYKIHYVDIDIYGKVMQNSAITEHIPLDESISFKNIFYHSCEFRGIRVSYKVCLHTLDAYDEGRLGKKAFVDCQKAACKGICPARKMRQEEIDKGEAIYYEHYEPSKPAPSLNTLERESSHVSRSSQSYQRGYAGRKSEVSTERATSPKVAVKPKSDFEKGMNSSGNYADVINETVKQAQPSNVEPTPAAKLTARDIARRMMEKRNKNA